MFVRVSAHDNSARTSSIVGVTALGVLAVETARRIGWNRRKRRRERFLLDGVLE